MKLEQQERVPRFSEIHQSGPARSRVLPSDNPTWLAESLTGLSFFIAIRGLLNFQNQSGICIFMIFRWGRVEHPSMASAVSTEQVAKKKRARKEPADVAQAGVQKCAHNTRTTEKHHEFLPTRAPGSAGSGG